MGCAGIEPATLGLKAGSDVRSAQLDRIASRIDAGFRGKGLRLRSVGRVAPLLPLRGVVWRRGASCSCSRRVALAS